MRAFLVTLTVGLATACGGTQPGQSSTARSTPADPVSISPDWSQTTPLAYRLRGESKNSLEGAHASPFDTLVFILGDEDVGPRLRPQEGPHNATPGWAGGASEGHLSRLLFPTPSAPLTDAPLVDRWTFPNLGSTTNSLNPDIEFVDTFSLESADPAQARFVVLREGVMGELGRVVGRWAVTFDRVERRYTSVEGTFEVTLLPVQIGNTTVRRESLISHGYMSVSVDDERSRARTVELQEIAQARVEAAEEYQAFVAAHPSEGEALALLEGLEPGDVRVSSAMSFQLVADPGRLFRLALTHENPALLDRFLELVALFYALPMGRLPGDVVAVLRAANTDSARVQEFMVSTEDARFRTEFRRIARRTVDPDLRERAAGAITAGGQTTDFAALRHMKDDVNEFVMAGTSMLLRPGDPRGLVPVLIDVLVDDPDPSVRDLCVQWLEALTRRVFGADVEAWRRFWRENESISFDDWLVAAATSGAPLLRSSAFNTLGRRVPTDAGRRALLDNLDHESPPVRLAAACALARWGDHRALPVLLDKLSSPFFAPRSTAFLGLAWLRPDTLGYDPAGEELERERAVARWRRWAEVR